MKKFLTLITLITLIGISPSYGQTTEELRAEKAEKEAELNEKEAALTALTGEVDALKAEVDLLTDLITPYPRWETGLLGNVGLSIAQFNDWLSKAEPNTSATNIGVTMTGIANADYRKTFWRNGANLTLGWLKYDNEDDDTDTDDFRVSADAFNLTSLFGYKLSSKLALSTLGEYRTALLDGKFNDPGYLDIGAGATWTPIENLVVVVHPLNYNIVFSSGDFDYQSSLGTKLMADYTRNITSNIGWKSNLSAFISYEGSDLNNWTWVNSFSTAVKGIGIGLDVGLRSNKQEALAAELDDNPLQTYWLLGLSYAISSN